MDYRTKEVMNIGIGLFSSKTNVDSLWQEIALNFYPERADFTFKRIEGDEFADHLFTSYPVLARRELGNLIASSLRPTSRRWFSIHVENDDLDKGDHERAFLEHLENIQWRAMYNKGAGLVQNAKQVDHDFVAFGQGVLKYGLNPMGTGLLFENFHLKDCTWMEGIGRNIDALWRWWKPTAKQLKKHFPMTVSKEVNEMCRKDPDQDVRVMHMVLPRRMYKYNSNKGKEFPFVSIFIEVDSETVLEEVGQNYFGYIIPRWHTISGSQYGRSMATEIALPDGRTSQVVMRTLREAGEKYVDPPMIAISDAIRGDAALYAGGITIADIEYDERLGEVLRPISQDKSGMPIGFDVATAIKEDIREGFFLDRIQLPETNKDMTAFEVRQRIEEHIRAAAPIFEPIEEEYNMPLCDGVFDLLMANGAFPTDQMPDSLQGQDINFSFRSPTADMADRNEAEMFKQIMAEIIIPAAQVDPAQMKNVNLTEAVRDAMRSAGWKQEWFNPVEMVQQQSEELAQQKQAQEMLAMAGQAGGIAKDGGAGIKMLTDATQNAQAAG